MTEFTFVELFSGAGLLGGGFEAAGAKPIFACELDQRAVRSYNTNLLPVAQVWDASKIPNLPSYDVLLAGPPCQGFSTLGKRDPADSRNSLSLIIHRWAVYHKPSVVVIENVPQFVESVYWRTLRRRFRALGYDAVVWILDAADFGVPQHRLRSFTLFSRIGFPSEPSPTKTRLNVRQAFEDLPTMANGQNLHIAPTPGELALARFKLIPRNGDKRDLLKQAPELCPPSWKRMGQQAINVWGRINWETPANTIRCCFQNASKGRYIHPEQHRVISLREGARLQGVPDHWTFCGDNSSIARQIGNGVPVPLAKTIATQISGMF